MRFDGKTAPVENLTNQTFTPETAQNAEIKAVSGEPNFTDNKMTGNFRQNLTPIMDEKSFSPQIQIGENKTEFPTAEFINKQIIFDAPQAFDQNSSFVKTENPVQSASGNKSATEPKSNKPGRINFFMLKINKNFLLPEVTRAENPSETSDQPTFPAAKFDNFLTSVSAEFVVPIEYQTFLPNQNEFSAPNQPAKIDDGVHAIEIPAKVSDQMPAEIQGAILPLSLKTNSVKLPPETVQIELYPPEFEKKTVSANAPNLLRESSNIFKTENYAVASFRLDFTNERPNFENVESREFVKIEQDSTQPETNAKAAGLENFVEFFSNADLKNETQNIQSLEPKISNAAEQKFPVNQLSKADEQVVLPSKSEVPQTKLTAFFQPNPSASLLIDATISADLETLSPNVKQPPVSLKQEESSPPLIATKMVEFDSIPTKKLIIQPSDFQQTNPENVLTVETNPTLPTVWEAKVNPLSTQFEITETNFVSPAIKREKFGGQKNGFFKHDGEK